MELAFTTANGTTNIDPDEFYLDDFAVAKANNSVTPSTPACSLYVGLFNGYFPDLLMHTDYYAFGMQMPGRTWYGTAEKYRYSMNGQEKQPELFAGAQSAEFWMYDARIGRRWETDPIPYEWQSPYAAFNNNPIFYSDPRGLEGDGDGDTKARPGSNMPKDKIKRHGQSSKDWDDMSSDSKTDAGYDGRVNWESKDDGKTTVVKYYDQSLGETRSCWCRELDP